jgi:formate/nitrite transporter FocA (FNT family)
MVSLGVNLLFATVGNIIGGTLLVAMVYWFVYLREESPRLEARGERGKPRALEV